METPRLGRIVNTDHYDTDALRKAVAEFNKQPAHTRLGENLLFGTPKPKSTDAVFRNFFSVDSGNVALTDVYIVEEDGLFYAHGNTSPGFECAIARVSAYGFGIRVTHPTGRDPESNVQIFAVDLVNADVERRRATPSINKGISLMPSTEKETVNNLVTFPIACTLQYSEESLARAVEAWNNKPASERWGEDRLAGYGAPVSELTHPDPVRSLLENVCITKEKTGYVFTADDVGFAPAALLAKPYGREFAIRGIATVSDGKKQLEEIISIDLVRTKELFSAVEVAAKVLEWSTERKILTNGKVASQVSKYFEEAGELAAGICKGKRDLVIDSIGDALVVLTNVMGIAKRDLRIHLHRVLDEVGNDPRTILSDDPHELLAIHMESMSRVLSLFRTHAGRLAERLAKDDIEIALLCLWDLARLYDTTVDECMSDAWNEIKDRRGFLSADGVFVKEGDA